MKKGREWREWRKWGKKNDEVLVKRKRLRKTDKRTIKIEWWRWTNEKGYYEDEGAMKREWRGDEEKK